MTEKHSINDDCCPYHLFLRSLYKIIIDTEVTPPEIVCGIATIAAAITVASNRAGGAPVNVLEDSFCKIYRDEVGAITSTLPSQSQIGN
jgi:hypothetical protein